MNILFSSDDNYAQHLGVAIYSLLDKNRKIDIIRIFVVNNRISEDNICRLNNTVTRFKNAELLFLSFGDWEPLLSLRMEWPISVSAYARLFAADMLPQSIDRVLYFDCDMVINDDLTDLWHFDLSDCCIGAVQDQVPSHVKTAVGVDANAPYFNSGLLLIDLKKWRQEHYGEKCLHLIEQFNGNVIHHDQGVLNGVFFHHWKRLPLKYNVMTIHYFFSQRKIRKYYCDCSPFYSETEINLSVSSPVVLHYTPSFTSHPWECGCNHPLKDLYSNILKETPWAGFLSQKSKYRWYQKLINWRFRTLPF